MVKDLNRAVLGAIDLPEVVRENKIRQLVSCGADLNYIIDGELPLIVACRQPNSCSLALVELLVELGADVNGIDEIGNTPLIAACSSSSPRVVVFLLNAGACVNQGERSILNTAVRSDIRCVQVLLEAGANPNGIGTPTHPPMWWAFGRLHKGIVDHIRLLLDWNAIVNCKVLIYLLSQLWKLTKGVMSKEDVTADEEEQLIAITNLVLRAAEWSDVQWLINDFQLGAYIVKELPSIFGTFRTPLPLQVLCRKTIRKALNKGYIPDKLQLVVQYYYGDRPPLIFPGQITLLEYLKQI